VLSKNGASPKAKTPPSLATNQYPCPSAVLPTPLTDLLRTSLPVDPKKGVPNEKIPPSEAASQ
jgi:hypothetical protein